MEESEKTLPEQDCREELSPRVADTGTRTLSKYIVEVCGHPEVVEDCHMCVPDVKKRVIDPNKDYSVRAKKTEDEKPQAFCRQKFVFNPKMSNLMSTTNLGVTRGRL